MNRAFAAKICVLLTGAIFLLVPALAAADYPQPPRGAPPIEQPLIREGTLAFRLAEALGLGTPASEVEAETWLGERGVMPENGWIADYPVTPDILGEVEQSLEEAVYNHEIDLNKAQALGRLDRLVAELGIEGNPGENGGYAQATQDENLVSEADLHGYYYDAGPPVVTYYEPPPDYSYLYSWVPYPFWCDGLWFGGYFILNDFDVPVFADYDHDYGHHHHHERREFVSNHFFNGATNHVALLNPVTRDITPAFRGIGATGRKGNATAFENRAFTGPAQRIIQHGSATGPLPRVERPTTERGTPVPRGSGGALFHGMTGEEGHGDAARSFARPGPALSANGGSFKAPRAFTSPERNFSAPRSFTHPAEHFNNFRSFSPPARNFAAPRQFTPPAEHFNNFRSLSPPAGNFAASRAFNPPAGHFNSFRSFSPPTRSFAMPRQSSPPVGHFNNFRSFSPPAGSFVPRSSFQPSFQGGFRAAPSFHAGAGFAGVRGRR